MTQTIHTAIIKHLQANGRRCHYNDSINHYIYLPSSHNLSIDYFIDIEPDCVKLSTRHTNGNYNTNHKISLNDPQLLARITQWAKSN